MNQDRDKYLAESMGYEFGSVFGRHGGYYHGQAWKKDGQYAFRHVNFSDWIGFGKLWEWAQNKRVDGSTVAYHCLVFFTAGKVCRVVDYLNPDRFASAVYEFLKGRES